MSVTHIDRTNAPDQSDVAPDTGDKSRETFTNRKSILRMAAKFVATLIIVSIAGVSSLMTWQYYVDAPWTRNGAVRVQVANVAPQVAGQIVELRVTDNKYVHQGDVLYVIDPFNYEVAVRSAQANLDQRAADLQVKQAQSVRRAHLTDDATTPE